MKYGDVYNDSYLCLFVYWTW